MGTFCGSSHCQFVPEAKAQDGGDSWCFLACIQTSPPPTRISQKSLGVENSSRGSFEKAGRRDVPGDQSAGSGIRR